jgi:hypothetical protein
LNWSDEFWTSPSWINQDSRSVLYFSASLSLFSIAQNYFWWQFQNRSWKRALKGEMFAKYSLIWNNYLPVRPSLQKWFNNQFSGTVGREGLNSPDDCPTTSRKSKPSPQNVLSAKVLKPENWKLNRKHRAWFGFASADYRRPISTQLLNHFLLHFFERMTMGKSTGRINRKFIDRMLGESRDEIRFLRGFTRDRARNWRATERTVWQFSMSKPKFPPIVVGTRLRLTQMSKP